MQEACRDAMNKGVTLSWSAMFFIRPALAEEARYLQVPLPWGGAQGLPGRRAASKAEFARGAI